MTRRCPRVVGALFVSLACAAHAFAETPAGPAAARPPLGHADTTYTFGIGAFAPDYVPPTPGTYELPPIDNVSDHALVDAAGKPTTLDALIGGRLAVVSFIYATCSEAAGCPMSTAVLRGLDQRLLAEPELAKDVALLSISFDPQRDTSERLTAMQGIRGDGSTWQFVTARDEAALAPLLDDFGQTISKLHYADGTWTGVYRHVLKVFLLDRDKRVRNIYSVGFLHADLVLADLKTLDLEPRR